MGEWVTLGVLLASETLLGFHIWILDLLALLDTFVPVYWFKVSTANKQLAHWKAAFVGDADAQLAADGVRVCLVGYWAAGWCSLLYGSGTVFMYHLSAYQSPETITLLQAMAILAVPVLSLL